VNTAWLDQWLKDQADVLRRAKADVEKNPGGGNASLRELKAYVQERGAGKWTLLEVEGYYLIIRAPVPTITVHLGQPKIA
jgi:hypothetical protein